MRVSLLLLASAVVLLGCGNGSGEGTEVAKPGDVVADGALETAACVPFKLVGQPCDDGCECLGGLCVLSEYAPFRFCTRGCGKAAPGAPCEPEVPGQPWNALCVEFPADFLVSPRRFCAPLCQEMKQCEALGAPWEACEPPSWKGNPLYGSQPDRVCISPSAQGHEPVDPDTCQGWELLYTDFALERATCLEYCQFLATCQLLSAKTSIPCCAFDCAARMIPKGAVDKEYFKQIRCFVDNYSAFQGTALVCSKPTESCGAEPEQP